VGMSEQRLSNTSGRLAWALSCALAVVSCGGSTGNSQDSGTNKTYLTVARAMPTGCAALPVARDRGARSRTATRRRTVWTMPDGPGLHFAYVTVSDGRGGYIEQQYAVSSDFLETEVAPRTPVSRVAPASTSTAWNAGRLRFQAPGRAQFRARRRDRPSSASCTCPTCRSRSSAWAAPSSSAAPPT
jgi:hypothetical protein